MKKFFAVLLAVLIFASLPTFASAAGLRELTEDAAARVRSDLAAAEEQLGAMKKLAVDTLRGVLPYVERLQVSGAETERALTNALLRAYNAAGMTDADLPAAAGETGGEGQGDAPAAVLTKTNYTAAELSRLIRKYLFIRIDNPDEIAALIAETCEFDYAVIEGGDGTLYLRVDVENNPQIFNYDVFRKLVEDLYARQNEEMKKDGYGKIDYVMSYEHIAGELALHVIVFAAANEIIRLTNTKDERILSLYRSAAVAELNVDEARLPSQIIELIGRLIVNVFKFNFFKLFSFLA